jgi:hypothetical protein
MTTEQRCFAYRKLAYALGVILLLSMVVGCQTSGTKPTNRTVTEGDRVAILPGGPHTGRFVTRDMTIAYQYHVADAKLYISGTSDLKYAKVAKLSMTLYYLDDNGTVIDYYRFFARPRKVKMGKVMDNTFSREFDIVPEAKAFSIGYTGKTQQNAREGSWVFQYSPF